MAKFFSSLLTMAKTQRFTGRGGKNPSVGSNKTSSGKKAAFSQSKSSTNPDVGNRKNTHLRTASKVKILNMYNDKPTGGQLSKKQSLEPARIAPDRRWFGNTRVMTQDNLQKFREHMQQASLNPTTVVLKQTKLPLSLLSEETTKKVARMNLLSIEPYNEVFGPKNLRKRSKVDCSDLTQLMESSVKKRCTYNQTEDAGHLDNLETEKEKVVVEDVMRKGTSRRIWGELWKVVDSSDILLEIVDARDPEGTRCRKVEKEILRTRKNKHIVIVLNKCDLVPTQVTQKWVRHFSKEFPTIAFRSSITNSFGKSSLLQILRQYSILLKDRKHVSIGFLGYPNVGKSSVINTLKAKKVCKSAPIPGETKVWQYISLTKRIYLIDSPGIVPIMEEGHQGDIARVLQGVVRVEKVSSPEDYVEEVLKRVSKENMRKRYELPTTVDWDTCEEFLNILTTKYGRKMKGGDLHVELMARTVLFDWQRGKIPFYCYPPKEAEEPTVESAGAEQTEESKLADQVIENLKNCTFDSTELSENQENDMDSDEQDGMDD